MGGQAPCADLAAVGRPGWCPLKRPGGSAWGGAGGGAPEASEDVRHKLIFPCFSLELEKEAADQKELILKKKALS